MIKNYDEMAEFIKIFTNPIRLKIIDTLINSCSCNLTKAECCVCEINENIDLPQPYISKHLKILKDQGILKDRREGNKIFYSFYSNDLYEEFKSFINQLFNCLK